MFSDQGRAGKILLALLLLVGLGAWHAYASMTLDFGYRDCLEAPAESDGRTLIFPLWSVTRIDGPDRYAVSKILRDVPVQGDTSELKIGTTISIKGTFRASDLALVESEREIHVLRRWKEALGVVGLLVAAALTPLLFRWRGGYLVERGGG